MAVRVAVLQADPAESRSGRSDHAQILSCLTETSTGRFRLFRLHGKEAYDREIENPAFTGAPIVTITRMVEQDDVVMAEMTLEARRATASR